MRKSRCTSRPSLSWGRSGWSTGVGSGWAGGNGIGAGLCSAALGVTEVSVWVSLMRYVLFMFVSSVPLNGVTIQPTMTANRRWRLPFRCRGSRRELAVAQLTLGHFRTYDKPSHWRVDSNIGDRTSDIGDCRNVEMAAISDLTDMAIRSLFYRCVYYHSVHFQG